MVRYRGVNHLAMATVDLGATIRFWRDLLGMRLVITMGREGYRHYFFEIDGRDMIAFFEWPDVEPIEEKEHGRPIKGPFAFDHVSIGVESDEDLWQLKAKLEAADIWVSEVMNHGYIHSIYSFDPNGIAIEFSADVCDMDVRRTPQHMDEEPGSVASEGVDPQRGKWPEPKSVRPVTDRRVYPGAGSEYFQGYGKDE